MRNYEIGAGGADGESMSANRKRAAKLLFAVMFVAAVTASVFCVMSALVYRFHHPDLTETRLLMVLWPNYVGTVLFAWMATHWWINRPGT